ncbi:uncharacterized protein LOC119730824 isoform X2 [Patiria miniata]|uniref:RabBD domain-containing protein n=1 Tax=Patiria miniata TaxID=46514 RepID=A0A914A7N0_PATMI|nr:uncharacterized protein LOC119730824 isoform X2 [Patiria miniata]
MSSSEKVSHQESSGGLGQMVSQRLSPSLIDLQHLSEEERNIIFSVLDRDEQLRQHDQERVKMLKNELHDLRKKGAVNAADENDNARVCIRCREPLGLLFNTGDSCPKCQHKVCKACQVTLPSGTRWLCSVCHKNMQLQLETGEWHFSQLQVDQVPLFGSDLVKASLAKAKHSLTDPTTIPVLTASDLRSDSRSSLQGKKRSDPGKGRHHKGRQDSRTSSDYTTSRQSSQRSARYDNSSSGPNSPAASLKISSRVSSSLTGNTSPSEVYSEPEDYPRGGGRNKWKKVAAVSQAGGRFFKRKGDGKSKTSLQQTRTHNRSNSSGSEPVSVTDSSEVDGVLEPISGFTFQRVSFRKDRKGSGKQDSSKDTTDQAHQVYESLSSDKGACIFSDSGLDDSMCSGQTGTSSPSDSQSPSPWEMVSMYEAKENLLSSGTSPSSGPPSRTYMRQGSDMTVDSCTQTIPTKHLASGGQAACPLEDHSADRNSPAHVDLMDQIALHEYYLDMLGGTQNNETGFLLKDLHSNGNITQRQIIRPQPARGAIDRSQSPKTVLKISPNSAFTSVSEIRKSPEGRESTFTEPVTHSTGSFAPILNPDPPRQDSIDVAYSLNSLYLEHEVGLFSPSQQVWQDLNKNILGEDVFSPPVLDLRPGTSSSILQASSSSNQNPTDKDTYLPHTKRPSITDFSSSDSGTTPSDESDSLCELELDWDLRASSPDFQEVQLQTKLKKNQDLMRELMKEAHNKTPEFFLKTASVSPDTVSMNSKPCRETVEVPHPEPHRSSQPPANQFPLQSQVNEKSVLGQYASSGTDDADLSSSVSSWIDSDPSSDDNIPGSLSTFTPAPSSVAASGSIDKPANLSKPTSKKRVIARPDWAAMKVQQWKASSIPSKSFRMKRPGGRSEAFHAPKVVSSGPVLITQKNKGMYVVNPGSDDEDSYSDSSSDETDSDVEPAKRSHPRKIPGRGGSDHLKYSYCSSSDSELSTILEVSEDDQSGLSVDSGPVKPVLFTMADVVIPSIVVSEKYGLSSTEEDADDEAENPDLLNPEYEPKTDWAETV